MTDQNQKADRPNGVFTDVEADGRIKFVVMRHGKAMSHVVLPPHEVCQHTSDQFHSFEADAAHYDMVWDAALQLIEGGASDHRS